MLKTFIRFNVYSNKSNKLGPIVNRLRSESCSKDRNPIVGNIQFRNFYLLPNNHLFNCSSHHLTNQNHEIQLEKKNNFWNNYRKRITFKQRCISRISTLLNCSEEYAQDLIREHSKLFFEDIDTTIEMIYLLINQNIPETYIKNHIWILYFSKPDLESRLNAIKQWDLDNSYFLIMLPLLKLTEKIFYNCSDIFIREKLTIPYGNRVIYLSKLLETSLESLIPKLISHKYLLFREFRLIEASIKAFEEYGISKEDLAHDTWALRYKDTVIRKRLEIVKKKGLTKLRPWLVRCSDSTFKKLIDAHEIEQSVMHPFKTREEYLSHRLQLDIDEIRMVSKKYPELLNTSITKQNTMINILLTEGYSGKDIIFCPRIFLFNIETVKQRIIELKTLGIENSALCTIIKRKVEYEEMINRIQFFKSQNQILV